MATVTMTLEEYQELMEMVRSATDGNLLMTSPPMAETPSLQSKKRKRSKYSKELSKQLKILKKKHPRTAITKLMKRAHSLTRKALK